MFQRRRIRLFAGLFGSALFLIPVSVALAICHPSLYTLAASGTVGQPITDAATIKGGQWPTGTLTWTVYSSSDTSCSTPLFTTAPVTVAGNGTYTSPPFTPSAAGTYQWVASYSGDSWNAANTTKCNDPNEQSVVSPASPAIATTASSGTAGQPVSDSATLSGGDSPSGSITWTAYTSSDTSCLTPVFTSAPVSVSGDGTYSSPSFTPTAAGTYQWVASYSGDANNNPVASACGDTNEQSVVSPASPSIATTASSNVTLGQPVTDVATLSGGDAPSGSITWNVYMASTSCATSLDTVSVAVHGDGPYTSPSFTPTSAGTYQWVATYSGDANNNPVSTTCDDPSEMSVVNAPPSSPPSTPGISVVKLQRVGSSGAFKSGTVTTKVGKTIEYEIRATNTGNTPLTLSLSDPLCNAGTIKGPFEVSGTLTGDVLFPGGVAQYTCSHVLRARDHAPFTNTATVTGTPPSGPAVTGTAKATAKKRAVKAIKVVRCGAGKVKRREVVRGKTVTRCVTQPAFTG